MKKNKMYREERKENDLNLINKGIIFNEDNGKKPYLVIKNQNTNGVMCPKADLLLNGKNNLYHQIVDEVVLYFALNNIKFHHLEGDSDCGFCIPSGHTLSSQISCINHLYPLRYDKDAVLSIAKQILPEIVDVFEIETDKYLPGYIAFEVVSKKDHLNEIKDNMSLSRGTMCTSIDALIYGKLENGSKIIIPIEWKYTENYHEDGKTDKDYSIENRGYLKEAKGKERLMRYSSLITNSKQLVTLDEYKNSIYFFEPFYQLMRQTLWAEELIKNKAVETIKADEYIHVHVIPSENKELLEYQYPTSGKRMLLTWKSCLYDSKKYILIEPKKLLEKIDQIKYHSLLEYLSIRYWNVFNN